jgi:hypothetical protein
VSDGLANDIVSGVVSTLLVSLLFLGAGAGVRAVFAGRSKYIGEYFGYHLLSDAQTIVRWKVNMTFGLVGLRVRMEEVNKSGYIYEGGVTVIDGVMYAKMRAKTHDAMGFLVAQMPFNKGLKVYSFFALLTGINPHRWPGSTKLLISRQPESDENVIREFKDEPSHILLRRLPITAQAREIIQLGDT